MARIQKFFRVYRRQELPSIQLDKHYFGIFLTALGWLCIWLSYLNPISCGTSFSYYNYFFYQHLIAFMCLSLWAGLRGKMCFFSKNPGGIIFNSLCVVASYLLFFVLRLDDLDSSLFSQGSYFLNFDCIFVACIALFFLKQKMPRILWLGLFSLLVGTALIQGTNFKDLLLTPSYEISISLLHCLVLSLLLISTNYLIRNKNPSVVICLYNTLFGFLCFGLLSFSEGISVPNAQEFFTLTLSGLLYALSILLFTSAHAYSNFYALMPMHSIVHLFTLISRSIVSKQIPENKALYGVALLFLGFLFVAKKMPLKKKKGSLLPSNLADTAA